MLTITITAGIFASVVFVCASLMFVLAMALRNNSIIDIAYGPIYLVASVATIWVTESFSLYSILAVTLVALWSARLGLRILHKNVGQPEDARYAAWREEWLKRGQLYFVVRSFLQVFMLQGLVIVLVALPVIVMISYPMLAPTWTILIGVLIWVLGFCIETIADWQLDNFINKKKEGGEKSAIMKTGLWRYSRHPNYFGETLMWWGLTFIALHLPFGYVAIISPLLITYVVTKITGPLLEQVMEEKHGEEFTEYKKTTSYFWLWPPKIN